MVLGTIYIPLNFESDLDNRLDTKNYFCNTFVLDTFCWYLFNSWVIFFVSVAGVPVWVTILAGGIISTIYTTIVSDRPGNLTDALYNYVPG